LERPALSDHFYPNLLLLLPLFEIKPSVLWLSGTKIAAYLITAILLIKTGRLIGLPYHWSYAAPIIFLLHEYTINTLLFEFQPSSLALPFIVLSFNLAIQQKYKLMLISLLIILGFKEHLSIIWICVGLFTIVQNRHKNWGYFLISGGFFWGIVTFFVIMPYLSGGIESLHSNRFDPSALLDNKIKFIFLSFLSVGLLPLFYPKTLLFIIPAFGISLISNQINMVSFNFHYHDIAMPILFVGVIFGLKKIYDNKHCILRDSGKFTLFAIFMCIIFMNRTFPMQKIQDIASSSNYRDIISETHYIHSRLDLDKNIQLWVTERFSCYFLEHPVLKSIDVWGGSNSAMLSSVSKVIILPKDINLSSLEENLYKNMLENLNSDSNKNLNKKIDDFNHFIIYDYR